MSDTYILAEDGKTPIICNDPIIWGAWLKNADRHVDKTEKGDIKVSTVFLGLDHGMGNLPILFETMIFGGENDEEQWRYSTWEEAEEGHRKACIIAFGETEEKVEVEEEIIIDYNKIYKTLKEKGL